MKRPRSSPWMSGSTTTTPSITSDGRILAIWPSSVQLDDRVVAEHEPQRPGPSRRSGQLDLAADEAVGEAGDVDDAAAGEHHGVLQLGVDDLAVGADRAEGADVAVHHAGARPDDGGVEEPAGHQLGARLGDHPAPDGRPGVYRSLDPRLQRLEHQPVALEQRILLARVDPPALEDLVVDAMAVVDQPLEGVGVLHLPPPRRLDGGDGVVHAAVEQVDTHQRQVGRRVDRLLDQPHDLAPVRQLGYAELAWVVDPGQQDLRRGRRSVARRLEAVGEAGQPLLQHVVAQVHHEVVLGEELPRDQHAVSQPQWLVLPDVGDVDAPAGSVANRRHDLVAGGADDDADLLDARLDHVLDAVEEDRLVGDGHELLGARVGDGPETAAGAPGEDETFHGSYIVAVSGTARTQPHRVPTVFLLRHPTGRPRSRAMTRRWI